MDRSCGDCSLCCKLLEIPALDKTDNDWCKHCKPGKGGCTIYDSRPDVCRTFRCLWLGDKTLGNEWYPLRAKMFLFGYVDATADPNLVRLVVDPAAIFKWRKSPYRERLAEIAKTGLVTGRYHTVAQVGRRVWLLTPSGDHEITGHAYEVTETPHGWDVKWQ